MGRTVVIEEHLFTYLSSLSRHDGYTIGLILGQNVGQKDFVVHLARSPPPMSKDIVEETTLNTTKNVQQSTDNKYIKSINDIPASWLADHAKHVTRMLPGGIYVLGIFVIGPESVIINNNNIQKMKSILNTIHTNLSSNKYLCGNKSNEYLILDFNSTTQKCNCKSININDGSVKPADCKFSAKSTKWHQLETLVDFDHLFNYVANKDPKTLKAQLQDILKKISNMIEISIVAIDGEVRPSDEFLETTEMKKKNKNEGKSMETKKDKDKIYQISLYIPYSNNVSNEIKTEQCSEFIKLVGQLVSRTFVHEKAKIEEAIIAVKEDIMRSIASRLEMHWDSLIEEENGSPEENITLHEPPRRVLIALPQSKVTLSDYLFPGEGPQEALISLQELLDLEMQENNIQNEIEIQVDPSEFYCRNDIDATPLDRNKSVHHNRKYPIYLLSLSMVLLTLILAILIQLLYK